MNICVYVRYICMCMNECMYVGVEDGWLDGRTDDQMDRWMNEWYRDGQTARYKLH
jgi:hypothetical protein